MRIPLHIPKSAPQATALPPAQASLMGSLIGSGILHSVAVILIVTTASLWKSSATKTNDTPATAISVTFSPPRPEAPEYLNEQNTADSTIPDRSGIQPPDPDQTITGTSPSFLAFHLKKPRFADAPPLDLVTVSEGPQFGNSLPLDEPELAHSEVTPKPVKEAATPPGRPSTAKPSSAPPESTTSKKSPTTKQKNGISRSVRLKNRPSIHYPAKAKASGIQGSCIIEVAVNISGRVTSARIVKSSGNRSLDAEALRCARAARYYPAMKNGKTFAAKARLPFRFRMR